jgi:hypothetical protein
MGAPQPIIRRCPVLVIRGQHRLVDECETFAHGDGRVGDDALSKRVRRCHHSVWIVDQHVDKAKLSSTRRCDGVSGEHHLDREVPWQSTWQTEDTTSPWDKRPLDFCTRGEQRNKNARER